MKMFLNKKGTEKPIEIFVALFVILAVALLLLQLFQGQLSDQQSRLDEEARAREQEQLRDSARQYCNSACQEASSRGCTTTALASFCLSYASDSVSEPKFLDLNRDGVLNIDTTLLAGVAVCEDAVPCHAMIDRCCGQAIDHGTCKRFLQTHWGDIENPDNLVHTLVRTGTAGNDCAITENMHDLHWFRVARYDKLLSAPLWGD